MKTISLLLLLPCLAQSQGVLFISSPDSNPNTAIGWPFLLSGSSHSGRYQQVYAASDFSRLGSEGGFITHLSTAPVGGLCWGTPGEIVQVNLSTTLSTPDHLSLIFSENVGVDDTIVRPRGYLLDGGCDMQLDRPFFYSPSLGNLLLDVRIYQGYTPGPGIFASDYAVNIFGDSVSKVSALDVNATDSTSANTIGVWTSFRIIPVPEPSTLWLLGLGMGILGWRGANRKREGERAKAR
jgi:hypothetical protein